jgi:phosphatidylethanolamine-binding protein
MKELEVYFGNHKVKHKEILDLAIVQNQPQIKFNIEKGKYYTILMVDPDAPSRENPINKHWLHWLVINNDKTVVEFAPSDPPKNTGLHRYYIGLYEQKGKIQVPKDKYGRPKFPVQDFIQEYGLTLVECVMYQTERKN